jgi:hypothetical protein
MPDVARNGRTGKAKAVKCKLFTLASLYLMSNRTVRLTSRQNQVDEVATR